MRYVEETFERHKKKGEKKLPLGVFPRQEEFTSFTHPMFAFRQDRNVSDGKESIPIKNHINLRNN